MSEKILQVIDENGIPIMNAKTFNDYESLQFFIHWRLTDYERENSNVYWRTTELGIKWVVEYPFTTTMSKIEKVK